MAPAIRLAREGFPVDKHYAKTARELLDKFERYPVLKTTAGYVYQTHLRGGNPPQIGDVLKQPNLARLLDLPEETVNVKAKTGEAVGPIGREEAISAEAVVLLEFAGPRSGGGPPGEV